MIQLRPKPARCPSCNDVRPAGCGGLCGECARVGSEPAMSTDSSPAERTITVTVTVTLPEHLGVADVDAIARLVEDLHTDLGKGVFAERFPHTLIGLVGESDLPDTTIRRAVRTRGAR